MSEEEAPKRTGRGLATGGRTVSKCPPSAGGARKGRRDSLSAAQSRPVTGTGMFDQLAASKMKKPWSFPVRARANPPTLHQEPWDTQRYDAIAPPHRAGMKKMPKVIRAEVAPHLIDTTDHQPRVYRKMPARTLLPSRDQAQAVLGRAARSPRSTEPSMEQVSSGMKRGSAFLLHKHCLQDFQGWSTEDIYEWLDNADDASCWELGGGASWYEKRLAAAEVEAAAM